MVYYKLTQQGINKIGARLTVHLPEIYNKLQKILANDSTGQFDCLKDFVDFSDFELFLQPWSNCISVYDWINTVTQSANLSELTSTDKYKVKFKVWFLFKLLPGKIIPQNTASAWRDLQTALSTAAPKNRDTSIRVCLIPHPEIQRFAIPDTCQVLALFCQVGVTAADMEPA